MAAPSVATVTGQSAKDAFLGSGIVGGTGSGATGGITGRVTWTPPKPAEKTANVFGAPVPVQGVVRLGGGSVTKLPEEFMPELAQLGPQELQTIRQQLYTSGQMPAAYYGKNALPIPTGGLDADTAQGFYNAAKLAALTGSLDQLLSATSPVAGTVAGQERQPLVIELPNETDLHAVLKEAAMPLIGRDPTDTEMAAFTARFRSLSEGYQRAAYAAGGAGLPGGPGGTVTKPPSGSAAAEEFLQQRAPVEAGAQRMEGGLGVLLKLFSGGG